MTETLVRVGGPVAVAGLALLILARPRELRLLGLALWAIGTVLVIPLLAPEGHTGLLAGAGVVGVGIAAAFAVFFRRFPWAFALLALAATPARIPVSIGNTDANLLVPLYVVVVAGALLLAWQLVRDEPRARELGVVAWPLALLVGWLGLSTAWTGDVREAAIELLFFLCPFGLLAVSFSRLRWCDRPVTLLYRLLGAMALLFAAVGIGQWVAKDVFWNPKVVVGNDVESFFRVNSLFWDPSMYGRFLAVAILATLVLLTLRLAAGRWQWLVAGIAVAWVGLFFSYSQSSFAALVAGILVLGAVAWRDRAFAAAAVAAAAVAALGATGPLGATGVGNRESLVSEGIQIAVDHPVVGVGLGGFKHAYAERLELGNRSPRKAASHSTPVTVAAETGFPGLLLLVWLVGAAAWAAFRRPRGDARWLMPRDRRAGALAGCSGARRQAEGAAGRLDEAWRREAHDPRGCAKQASSGVGSGPDTPAGASSRASPWEQSSRLARATLWATGLAVVAIVVHSCFYNAFFEDPMVWGALGLLGLAGARVKETA